MSYSNYLAVSKLPRPKKQMLYVCRQIFAQGLFVKRKMRKTAYNYAVNKEK